MTARLRRRSVLGLIAGLPALRAVGAMAADDPLARICARAGRDPVLAALGQAWCGRHPGLARQAHLDALAADLGGAITHEAELVAALRAQAVADFRDGRIVTLEGWRMSVTEARICAAGVARRGRRARLQPSRGRNTGQARHRS